MARLADSTLECWEDLVVTYCMSIGLQFGFQIFASRKASGTSTEVEWHPSTTLLAAYTLTEALRDVASRTHLSADRDTPVSLTGLACAVRELHGTIFQSYTTWLKAVKLRPAASSSHGPPNALSLHNELADLCLYWLIYSEAANLRHTPEMLWFIFFCAQRSWQAKQIVGYLEIQQAALLELARQPWLQGLGLGLGLGLPAALQALHTQYRRSQTYLVGSGLTAEATLRLPSETKGAAVPYDNDVAVAQLSSSPVVAAMAGDRGCGGKGSTTIAVDMTVDVPYCSYDAGSSAAWLKSGSISGGGPSDDSAVSRDGASRQAASSGRASPAAIPKEVPVQQRDGITPGSPNLPMPPAILTQLSGGHSPPSAFASHGVQSAAAASGPATQGKSFMGAASSLSRPKASGAVAFALTPQVDSSPKYPPWDPRLEVAGYRELLMRMCPDETAVAAALVDDLGGVSSPVFLTRVVQPLFLFLTEQVYELGQARRQGLESAVRIGYDDVSESMAHPQVVAAALAALPWARTTAATIASGSGTGTELRSVQVYRSGAVRRANDGYGHQQHQQEQQRPRILLRAALSDEELYWSRLLALSDLSPSGAPRIPWQGDMAHYRNQLLRLLHGGGESGSTGGRDCRGGVRGLGVAANSTGGGLADGAAQQGGGGEGDEDAPNMTVEQAAQAAAVMQSLAPEAVAEISLLRQANAATDWWSRHVLRKTFVEHRSLAMPLVAFARVFQFQLCWFYLLSVWSWSGSNNVMPWVASTAALHWGSNCLLWTMQAMLSVGPSMSVRGSVVPFYTSTQGKARRSDIHSAPTRLYGMCWWALQFLLLVLCWSALAAGLYIAYIVWPNQDLYGHRCYPLFGGKSCYWWITVVYGSALLSYEVLYRQLNAGGFAREHLYDWLLRIVPAGGTAAASSPTSPMYDPAVFLRTGLSYILGNTALWGCALGLKLVIDFYIIIRPAGPKLKEIMATNKLAWSFYVSWGWWPEGWSRQFQVDLDPYMAAAQVIVLFLLSLVSSAVAYSVAGALWGAVQGVRQGIGSIRHWRHIRAGFHRVQAAMRIKLLTPEETRTPQSRLWVRRALGAACCTALVVLLLPYTLALRLLRWIGCLPPRRSDHPKSWVEREETLAITAPFWNAIVRSMRGRDLLSDREAAALSFTAVSLSPAAMMSTWRRGGSTAAAVAAAAEGGSGSGPESLAPRETYLPPVAVYVAQIPHMAMSGSMPTSEQLEVLQEAYLYLLHLLVAIGAIPRSEQVAQAAANTCDPRVAAGAASDTPTASSPSCASSVDLTTAAAAAAAAAAVTTCPDLHKDNFHPDKFVGMPRRAWSHSSLVARRELLGAVVALVRALLEAGKAYEDTAGAAAATTRAEDAGGPGSSSVAAPAAAAATRRRAIDKLCMALHALGRCMTQMRDLPWTVSLIMNRVVVRQHYHQPAVKAVLHRGFCALVATNRNNATTWGAEHMPSYEDFNKVLSWLLAILRPTDEGTAPSNSEVVSLLADFSSGLLNPELPTPPRVDAMRSVSTLIPHYQETVLYALSSADVRRVLQRAGAISLEGSLPDDEVLFKNDEGAPTELLQYLLSEFPDEFRNLLERCRTLVPLSKDDPPFTLEDFLPYGRLYEHRAQLLLWASFRGQVLARTVDGMSMYRTALALQAVQDAIMQHRRRPPVYNQHLHQHQHQQPQRDEGPLKLSCVQRIMVMGIMRDTSKSVDELVAELVDVVPGLGPLLDHKYCLVVSSQVFAKMAESRALADRWRSHGVTLLATRYTALRVAYLEQDGEPLTLFKAPDFTYRVVRQASVLARAVPLEAEVAAGGRRARAARRAAASAATTPCDGAAQEAASGCQWPDGFSCPDEGSDCESDDVSDGGDADGCGAEDAGAQLRVWRRRYWLRNLKAAKMEVLFRQQLPVNYYDRTASGAGVILGEGKPENQNSAVPYCPGVVLQTIDMNQDNSLAQAFKLRNATREFEPLGPGPQNQQVAVVGYPEWIFSYRCGLLADLAAATERTFGTQIQRVMAYPSAVRAHYGHPDLWNRLFSMTRGGVSKANAVQHVSEDVFGGYNAAKRGGLSKYVSYISVGKGRDMGLDSILGFEGKISKGCAEQLMSRDLRFLGCTTDFFRSMSLYFTVPGHFINTWLTVQTIQLGVWVQLLLLLGGVGKSGGSMANAMGAVQILQLGTMPLIGYLFNLWLESGLAAALATLARQFVAGGLLFHIFRSVTSAFHLGRAVLFGGASYVATGRGFSLRRKTFTQVYVNYGRSHIYLGADILLMAVLILVVGNNGGNAMPIPAAALWSPLLVATALLAGPFWFTPYFFRLNQVLRDAREFRAWVAGSAARGVSESWPEWNTSQLSALRDDAGAQVRRYRFWSTLAILLPRAAVASLSAVVAVTGARFDAAGVPDLVWVLGGSGAAWILLALLAVTRKSYLTSGLATGWRWAKGLVQVAALAALAFLVVVCLFMPRKGLRFSGMLITLYGNYQIASLLVCVWVVWFPKTMLARSLANSAHRHTDAALGAVLSAVLIIICFIGEIGLVMLDKVQTLVQFNDRYSHSQAARPYSSDDDPVASSGGGGGGGGGGLVAAAAAALRRRLPSHLMLLAPMTPGGGGVGGGGTGGGSYLTDGGAAATPRSAPSSIIHGWVSPRHRGGSGIATPVFMFSNAALEAVSPTGRSRTKATPARGKAEDLWVGSVSPSKPAFHPAAPAVPALQASSKLSPGSSFVQPQLSSVATPFAAANAMATNDRHCHGGGGGGGGGISGTPTNFSQTPSRELSWSSSTPPNTVRSATSQNIGSSGSNRGTSNGSGWATPTTAPDPTIMCLSTSSTATGFTLSAAASAAAANGSGSAATAAPARARLPPSLEWGGAAVATAIGNATHSSAAAHTICNVSEGSGGSHPTAVTLMLTPPPPPPKAAATLRAGRLTAATTVVGTPPILSRPRLPLAEDWCDMPPPPPSMAAMPAGSRASGASATASRTHTASQMDGAPSKPPPSITALSSRPLTEGSSAATSAQHRPLPGVGTIGQDATGRGSADSTHGQLTPGSDAAGVSTVAEAIPARWTGSSPVSLPAQAAVPSGIRREAASPGRAPHLAAAAAAAEASLRAGPRILSAPLTAAAAAASTGRYPASPADRRSPAGNGVSRGGGVSPVRGYGNAFGGGGRWGPARSVSGNGGPGVAGGGSRGISPLRAPGGRSPSRSWIASPVGGVSPARYGAAAAVWAPERIVSGGIDIGGRSPARGGAAAPRPGMSLMRSGGVSPAEGPAGTAAGVSMVPQASGGLSQGRDYPHKS